MFLTTSNQERRNIFYTSHGCLHQHHYRVVYQFWFQFSLLYHTAIRIKVVGENHPAGENEQGTEIFNPFRYLPCSFEPETPVPQSGTQKTVGSRPCPKEINAHG